MMKNNTLVISPSEINKFIYCPYQWYYERKYGGAEIRRLAAEARSGAEHSSQSNFVRGAKYHSSFLRKYKFKRRLFIFAAVVIIILLFFVVIYYG